MRKKPNIPHQHCLEIPRTKKTYRWNAYSNTYEKTKGRYIEGDEGLEFQGRFYTYHPTKGWRSRAVKAA